MSVEVGGIIIVCSFSGDKMSQEKSKTMPMQIYIFFFRGGGGVEDVYGICASREYLCTQQNALANFHSRDTQPQ